ncbi:hypothetical protein MPTK1_1g28970 [Marchantia polymorpha subsp. ruderalis]|uniref:Uncharacterized protein n=2 Tax=Marchantia polymorpha TaxID=3197 RepID=A0AAF6AVE0_MARPO|nr:hypothetical protein MARPO_0107s0012 [Marchantia polymorpha]BBN00411.1 hypothetical protein Mp_1g28970 [Marchantia polymorpha subsp. ruderalis]|eukprot:PTQ31736.1 hypothetical protein MARPO_0107s0012 [Marchantia polymorpha]
MVYSAAPRRGSVLPEDPTSELSQAPEARALNDERVHVQLVVVFRTESSCALTWPRFSIPDQAPQTCFPWPVGPSPRGFSRTSDSLCASRADRMALPIHDRWRCSMPEIDQRLAP